MRASLIRHSFLFLIVAFVLAASRQASGDLVLNSTGIGLGFSITTFVSGMPEPYQGFPGSTQATSTVNGQVLVAAAGGSVYLFNDVNGQTASEAVKINSQLSTSGSGAVAFLNGQDYYAVNGLLYRLNADGSVNSLMLGGAHVTSSGLVADAANGHLYAGSNIDPSQNIADINVAGNSYTLHPASGGEVDAISPDGSTIYMTNYPVINGYSTQTFSLNWTSPTNCTMAGTIQEGRYVGDLIGYSYVSGDLYLIDHTSGLATLIGTGGTLGGYGAGNMGLDSTNGSLLLGQGSSILRVTMATPEPSSATALGVPACLFLVLRRRRARARCRSTEGPVIASRS